MKRRLPAQKWREPRILIMWITEHIAARTLIWLAALAIPVQGMSSPTCGCMNSTTSSVRTEGSPDSCCASGSSKSRHCPCTGAEVCHCGEASPCHKPAHACCSKRSATPSCCHCCCSKDSNETCPCGANCQCGKKDRSEVPATPPVENHSPNRIVADAVTVGCYAEFNLAEATSQHLDVCVWASAISALQRCVILCRFMA